MQQYASALGQPHSLPETRAAWLDWLVGHAVVVAGGLDGTLLFPGSEPHTELSPPGTPAATVRPKSPTVARGAHALGR